MKIIQVVPYYPPYIGGVQNVARDLSEELARINNEVEVLTSDIGCKTKKLKSSKKLKIHYLKGWNIGHTAVIPSLLFNLLTISKDSIVHLHVAQAFVPEVVYIASKIKKFKYIAHYHTDVEPTGKLGFLLPLYKKIILRKILASASRIVVLSKNYEIIVNKKYLLFKNIVVIPNGVSERFSFNKIDFEHKQTNLLYVGRLSSEKNIPKLINSVSMLNSNVIFNIVGDGEQKINIENYITQYNYKNIILHGKKIGQELLDFYKRADIFLLASDYEGLPLVLLEAMASGTPIIASDVKGIQELVNKDGVLVNPPTAENFAEAIKHLIKDKKRRLALSLSGREKAKGYSWNSIVNKFESLYLEVLNENR